MQNNDISDFYKDKSVLVTGGAGFIGSQLCRRLSAYGSRVTSISRSPQIIHNDSAITCRQVDLADAAQTQAVFKDQAPDIVFHLASHVVGKRDPEVVETTFSSNLYSSVNLLSASLDAGVEKVVLTGSLEEPTPDNQWPVPSSPYAAAKLAAGNYGRMFNALYGLPVVNLRVFMVYGPGQRDLNKLVPYVITQLLKGKLPNLSSGTRKVDWVFVEDVVDGYIRSGMTQGIDGQTFDIGSGELYTVQEVVNEIFGLIGEPNKPNFGSLEDRAMEQLRVADVATTQATLGWHPETSIAHGLIKTIEWYRTLLSKKTT